VSPRWDAVPLVLSTLRLKCLWVMTMKEIVRKVREWINQNQFQFFVKHLVRDRFRVLILETLATTVGYNIGLAELPLPVVRRLVKWTYPIYGYITYANDPYTPDFGVVVSTVKVTVRGKKIKVHIVVVPPSVDEKLEEYLPEGVHIL